MDIDNKMLLASPSPTSGSSRSKTQQNRAPVPLSSRAIHPCASSASTLLCLDSPVDASRPPGAAARAHGHGGPLPQPRLQGTAMAAPGAPRRHGVKPRPSSSLPPRGCPPDQAATQDIFSRAPCLLLSFPLLSPISLSQLCSLSPQDALPWTTSSGAIAMDAEASSSAAGDRIRVSHARSRPSPPPSSPDPSARLAS